MLPGLLLGLLIGVWVDRLPRRPIMITADLGRALLLASEGVENLLCNDIARSAMYSMSRPRCCSQHKEMRDCSSMTRLARQRAEEIALGQVVRAPVWVTRSLV